MLKNIILGLALTASALVFSGCSTVSSTEDFRGMEMGNAKGKPVAHVNANIYGFYFLDLFPVFCGSGSNVDKVAVFTDTVTTKHVVNLLVKEARGLGGNKLVDLKTQYSSHWQILSILFWERRINASATSVK